MLSFLIWCYIAKTQTVSHLLPAKTKVQVNYDIKKTWVINQFWPRHYLWLEDHGEASSVVKIEYVIDNCTCYVLTKQ